MSDKRRYFGTDGVRGKVGQYQLLLILYLSWAGRLDVYWQNKARKKSLLVKIPVFLAICWSLHWKLGLQRQD